MPVYAGLALLLGVTLLLGACSIGGAANLPAPPTATPTADTTQTPVPSGTPLPALQAKLITQTLTNIFPGNTSFFVDVPCPNGYIVASGGVSSTGTNFTAMVNVPSELPQSPDPTQPPNPSVSWQAQIFNLGSTTISAQVLVLCLRTPSSRAPKLTAHTLKLDIGDDIVAGATTGVIDMDCPEGTVVAGGGVRTGFLAPFTLMSGAPRSSAMWETQLANNANFGIAAEVRLVCLRLPGLQARMLVQPFGTSIATRTASAPLDITCPTGYVVAGGGISSTATTFTTMVNAPISTTKWRGRIYNPTKKPITAKLAVTCVRAG